MTGLKKFIPMAVPLVGEKEAAYVTETIRDGWISSVGGRFISEFESKFAAYCGVKHGVTVTSGTTAIHLALVAAGVGAGDEVILPPVTHVACANMVRLCGAKPVLVDCSRDTWGIDPARIESKITPQTKAIMVVHLYGHPVDMDPVMEIARRHRIVVIEDAAEAHGAEYKGRRCGSLGHMACFSFYANKIITTGEGGMVVTSDDQLAARARKFRDHAYEPEKRFWHKELGYNYRMTNLQAAVGLAQLERIDEFIQTHRRTARLYNELLAGVPGLVLPPEQAWAKNVYWMYSIIVNKEFGMTRDELKAHLMSRGVDSRTFFPGIHEQPLYAPEFKGQRFPVAEEMSAQGLNLPSGNELTEDVVRFIAECVRAAARK